MFKRKINITRINKSNKEEIVDVILYESAIDIFVNSKPLVNIICLPNNLKELAVGFLFSIGIINSINDLEVIDVNELEYSINVKLSENLEFDIEKLDLNSVSRVIDTTCGIPSPWRNIIKRKLDEATFNNPIKSKTDIKLNSNLIFSAIKKMQKSTPLYRETGGCHGAAMFDFEGNLISSMEDIGRHNAIDKVIGDMILKETPIKNMFLTSTGRLTGDSVLKAIRAKIPIVASLSAAIESGIKLAFAYGITLIGFARGSRMNIYTHPERIEI
ncbi:MAG: formate dehydrogenase accessory sulfurtransferase FdhD [Promethearchaeota archaeon]